MSEVHIASCVMHTRPDCLADTVDTVRARAIAEVSASDAKGCIVAVLEGSGADVLAGIEQLRALPGVLAVSLVYQHAEDEQALEEKMS